METNLDEWILDVTQTIEVAAERSVALTAMDAAQLLKDSFAANLKLTREAVRYRASGSVAKIGLQFPKTYAGNNTPTHRRFRTQWNRLQPEFRRRLQIHLIAALAER